MAKSMKRKSYKKKIGTRKNKKFFSVNKMKHAHKKHIGLHYLKGKHRTRRTRHGGCMCGGGKKMRGGMVSSPGSGPVG
jgi:hypothetical protein